MRNFMLATLCILFPFSARAEEREISNAEGVFLLRYDEQATKTPCLVFGVWNDGWAVREVSRDRDSSKYCYIQLKSDTVQRLKDRFEGDRLWENKVQLLEYGIPGAPQSILHIRFDSHHARMASCVEEFESGTQVFASATGVIAREGKSRIECMSSLPKEFLLQRLVWTEYLRLIEQLFLEEEGYKLRSGSLSRNGDDLNFEYFKN